MIHSRTQHAKLHKKALTRFNNIATAPPENSPRRYNAPNYGQHHQLFYPTTTALLTHSQWKSVQAFVGTFLYYTCVINNTMLSTLGFIATEMTTASWTNIHSCMNQFMNYSATHSVTKLKYISSAMHLWVRSDASYLYEPKSFSRAGGYFCICEKPNLPIKYAKPPPTINAVILFNRKVINAFMYSAQESETGAKYTNVCDSVPT